MPRVWWDPNHRDLIVADEGAPGRAVVVEHWQVSDGEPVATQGDPLVELVPATATAIELRRLADELDVVRSEMRAVDDRTIRSSGLGTGIARLRARADEIDGGQS